MRVLRDSPITEQYGGRFSGRVDLEMLEVAPDGSRPDVARVHCHDGAVTNWHHHPGGQLLLLLEGVGRIGNENEDFLELQPGTFVSTPPLERHWHGSASGLDCVWLTITWGETSWEASGPDSESQATA